MIARDITSCPVASLRVHLCFTRARPRLAYDVDIGTSRLVFSFAEKQVVLQFLPVLDGSAALVFVPRFKTSAASVQDVGETFGKCVPEHR